jgi:hypothetical protein
MIAATPPGRAKARGRTRRFRVARSAHLVITTWLLSGVQQFHDHDATSSGVADSVRLLLPAVIAC